MSEILSLPSSAALIEKQSVLGLPSCYNRWYRAARTVVKSGLPGANASMLAADIYQRTDDKTSTTTYTSNKFTNVRDVSCDKDATKSCTSRTKNWWARLPSFQQIRSQVNAIKAGSPLLARRREPPHPLSRAANSTITSADGRRHYYYYSHSNEHLLVPRLQSLKSDMSSSSSELEPTEC